MEGSLLRRGSQPDRGSASISSVRACIPMVSLSRPPSAADLCLLAGCNLRLGADTGSQMEKPSCGLGLSGGMPFLFI